MKTPDTSKAAFVAASADIMGDVTLHAQSSVWYTAVLRGDIAPIVVGEGSNVQDGAVLHTDLGYPCILGKGVTVGHRAIVHGATVHDGALIGMGAIVLTGAIIEANAVVGAGAVVREGMVVPAGCLAVGVPAVVKPAQYGPNSNAANYVKLAALHAKL